MNELKEYAGRILMNCHNALLTSNESSLQIVQQLALPCIGGTVPGPLHTIANDPSGGIYYSDELNHSVVSLNDDGSIRWCRTQRGGDLGEFVYPRGLSTGYIKFNGRMLKCLAVADAWNHRIQFLDLEGNPLTVWTRGSHGDNEAFGEIADVRFVSRKKAPGVAGNSEGLWYVLDRGNHRLCIFTIEAAFLGQVGSCFPPSMEKRWAIPKILFCDHSQSLEMLGSSIPFEYMFYPDHILGNDQEALFITQTGSRRLKQIVPPHLLPVSGNLGGNPIWVAADASGLLAWDPAGNHIMMLDYARNVLNQAKIEGEPVPSNLPSDEFWIQASNSIERLKWKISAGLPKCEQQNPHYRGPLSSTEKLTRQDLLEIQSAVEACLVHIDEEIKLAGVILNMTENDLFPQFMEGMSGSANKFRVDCSLATQRLHEALHSWCLGRLQQQITGHNGDGRPEQLDLKQLRKELLKQIKAMMIQIQTRIDSLVARQPALTAGGDNPVLSDSWTKVASITKSNLELAKKWIQSWSGIPMS
jgi:hypothetical protein